MLIEQIGPAACRSYLVGCERAGRVAWIDPLAEDVDRIVDGLAARGLALDLIVDTHTHADHVSGGRAAAERTGVPYALHETTVASGVAERLSDGQVIEVGEVRLEVLHTPGHTEDSITLRAGHRLFTGDFLFLAQDGGGRTDLPGGDAGVHWDSLQRLAAFGDDHVVHPGHDYVGAGEATLATERVRNPRLTNITREEYVTWQRAIALPTPAWMLEIVARNLGTAAAHAAHHAAHAMSAEDAAADGAAACDTGGACAAGPVDAVPLVMPAESHRRRSANEAAPYLLDVREPWEYHGPAGRHAPGAVLVPLGQVPARLGELPQDKDAEIHVICRSGQRSASATLFLIEQGYRRVFNVATGTDGWEAAGLPVER